MVYTICVVLVIRLKHLHDSQHTLCLMYHQVVYIWHNSGSVYLTLQLCLETYFMTNKLIRNSNFAYSSIPLSLISGKQLNLAIPIYKTVTLSFVFFHISGEEAIQHDIFCDILTFVPLFLFPLFLPTLSLPLIW